jgi:putative DNA primase/helicase
VSGHAGKPWVTSFEGDPNDTSDHGAKWKGHLVLNGRGVPNGKRNSYFSTAVFPDGADSRKKQHTQGLCAVVLDDVAIDDLEELPLAPTWVTETSPSNCQVGYDLQPGERVEDVDRLLRALTAAGHKTGPDKPGNNVCRYVRLPFGVNAKPSVIQDLGEPFACRLLDETEHRFTVAELFAAFGLSAGETDAREPQDDATDDDLRADLLSAESFHGPLARLSARFVGRGMDGADALAALKALMYDVLPNIRGDRKRLADWEQRVADLPRTVATAVRKYGDPRSRAADCADFRANREQISEISKGGRRVSDSEAPKTLDDWPDPEALGHPHGESEPFPVKALPEVIRNAVTAYAAYGKQPLPLIASSALATVSLACQGHADIARDERLVGPISLAVVPIASSGERKSACDKTFSALIRKAIKDLQAEAEERIKAAQARLDSWEAMRVGVKSALANIEKGVLPAQDKPPSGQPVTAAMLEAARQRLLARNAELAENKPVVPTPPRVMFGDTSIEAIAQKMQRSLPIGALWEDEGGQVIGGVGFREDRVLGTLTGCSKLWDGTPWNQDRASVEDREMDGKRMTINLMIQPAVLDKLFGLEAGLARTQGFMARMLICEPTSTMGTRLYTPPKKLEAVDVFTRRAVEWFRRKLPLSADSEFELDPPVLQLDPEAKQAWCAYHDLVETELKECGSLVDVPDFASKSAEQAVRIAGTFHLFSGHEPDDAVSKETMLAACEVAAWFLNETLRVIRGRAAPQEIRDAMLAWEWAKERETFTTTDLINYGPNALRKDKTRREAALKELERHCLIACARQGKKRTFHTNPRTRTDDDPGQAAA